MDVYRINKFLYQVFREREKFLRFIEGDDEILDHYELLDKEKEVLKLRSVTELHKYGVHTLLLLRFASFQKKDIRQLYEKGL